MRAEEVVSCLPTCWDRVPGLGCVRGGQAAMALLRSVTS